MPRPRASVFAFGWLVAVGALAAQNQNPAIGLKNRWYAQGGSASRSGAVATEPLDEAPEPAWTFAAPGPIRGEPLVWDDVVVFECELPKGKRKLQILGLADGQPLADKDFFGREATGPLAPALWSDAVVVRAGDKLKRYRLGSASITERRVSKRTDGLGEPLLVDGAIYVLVEGHVERWRADLLKPDWSSAEGGFRGALSVMGDGVFGLRANGQEAELVRLDAGTGRRRDAVTFPPQALSDAPQIAVGTFTVFLHDLGWVPLQGGGAINSLRYDLPLRPGAQPALASMAQAPAIGDGWWIAPCGSAAQPMLGLGKRGQQEFAVLAANGAHESLLAAPITLAGQVAYLGGVAVDTETLEVRWRIEAPPNTRAIPAQDTLLFCSGAELSAFRCRGTAGAERTRARRREWTAQFEELRHAELRDVVAEALEHREMELVDELLERAREIGVDEGWVADQARLRKARSRVKKKDDAERLAALRARADGIDAAALAVFWRDLEGRGLDADDHLRALRFVHDLAPTDPALATAVRAAVPAELRPAGEFDVGEWLGFVESTRAIAIDFVAAPQPNEIIKATADQLKLLEYRQSWRKDLVAVQSPRMIVYTPVDAPGGLTRCLSLGELVCDTLETMFAGYEAVRRNPHRMRILLFPTQREYKKYSPGGGHLAWTSGHYSPSEQLSRMFLPKDKQAFTRVMSVFVHELTHQWLQDRCPAIDAGKAYQRRADQAGYWIVEGFASFVEEFAFDLEQRTHSTDSPRDENLDILAHADPGDLLPWDDLLHITTMDFQRIDLRPVHRVKLGFRLGAERALSKRNFFYAQSGALCHWLWHAEDGKYRQALLDFVLAYYQGDDTRLDLAANLAMSADRIGAEVGKYAALRRP